MKLELGSGQRPTPGYISSDPYPHPNLDHICPAWETPGGPYSEVIALGVIEHLTDTQARDTFSHILTLLEPRGIFLFDVPDIRVWAGYLANGTDLFTEDHVLATIYGWQRWPGDEHKSGWTRDRLGVALYSFGYSKVAVMTDPAGFLARGITRDRFTRKGDAHLYVMAVK